MTDNPTIETSNLPAIADDAIAAINSYLAEEDPQNMIGKLIKFSKGEYLKGLDAEVVPLGTLVTVACDMTLSGFIRWEDGKPVEHKLVRVASGAPLYRRGELGYHDKEAWPKDSNGEPRDPWQPALYAPVMDAEGEIATFTTGSVSGIKSYHRLLRRYATHAARHPGFYPLVKLQASFFKHSDKSIGKVFYPDFEPAGYVERTEFVEALEAMGVTAANAPEQAALPAPKK
jgi:hypothetical protein